MTASAKTVIRLKNKSVESDLPVYAPLKMGDESVEIKLFIKCPTSVDYDKYMESMSGIQGDQYNLMYEPAAAIFVGWEGVVDENGEEIPFSKETLIELQKEYVGFTEGLIYAVTDAVGDLRGKNFTDSLTSGLSNRVKRKKAARKAKS